MRCPPDLRLAERTLTATELLRADLLYGHACPDPIRRCRIRAEHLAPDVAGAGGQSVVQLPIAGNTVVVAYNLPGANATLVRLSLSPIQLRQIYPVTSELQFCTE